MEKSESQQFRDELAETLKQTPKADRQTALDKAKEDPDYWQARTEKISERQNEEEIEEGFGVLVKKKTLYHGSGIAGIKVFNKAEEDTVGSGVYFTSQAKDAIGYARLRSRREKDSSPVIYEASVENMKLLDLRKDENVKKVMETFRPKLLAMKEQFASRVNKDSYSLLLAQAMIVNIERAIEAIDTGRVNSGWVRRVTHSVGASFGEHVKSLGCEGLITFEGGVGDSVIGGVGEHDTYLIFDPKKATIHQEHTISE